MNSKMTQQEIDAAHDDASRLHTALTGYNDHGQPVTLETLSYELGRYGATDASRKEAIAAYNAAQKPQPANDGGEAVDVADYQQAIRNLRETVAALKSEMHEIAVLLKYGEINADRAAFMLERLLASEVSSER